MKQKQLHVVYSDQYLDWKLGFGDGSHPTNPVRAKLATNLISAINPDTKIVSPTPRRKLRKDLKALFATHDHNYINETLKGNNHEWVGTKPKVAAAGFAMFRGTIRAVELLLRNKANVVFNPQGAKHHAKFGNGSGFCVFNDMAYAAMTLKKHGMRPLYIDWDIHAGDGVHHMLKGTGIPTISIHCATGYPGDSELQNSNGDNVFTNTSYNFNVIQGSGDDVFIDKLDQAAEIIDAYQPDVILLAAGADGHTGANNLGGMLANYTSTGFTYAAETIGNLAVKHNAKVLIGGAGGYQPLKETPETWALVVTTIHNIINKRGN